MVGGLQVERLISWNPKAMPGKGEFPTNVGHTR
jgi:hypothetical protein